MRWMLLFVLVFTCAAPSYAEPKESDSAGELRVLCNNVGIFPKFIWDRYPAKIREKKKDIINDEEKRARLLAESLLACEGDPDVVLLQEIWSLKARDVLIEELAAEYPYHKSPETPDAGPLTTLPAGLMIFSKYPLSDFGYKEFTRGFGVDKLSRKGIIGAKLEKDGKTVAVFTTHLQAGGKRDPTVKPAQLKECNDFIRESTKDLDEPTIILAGDFNIDSTEPGEYDEIFALLEGAKDTYQAGQSPLEGTTRNKKYPKKRIDFLLTFDDATGTSTIIDPAGETISDHIAIFGTVKLD